MSRPLSRPNTSSGRTHNGGCGYAFGENRRCDSRATASGSRADPWPHRKSVSPPSHSSPPPIAGDVPTARRHLPTRVRDEYFRATVVRARGKLWVSRVVRTGLPACAGNDVAKKRDGPQAASLFAV